MPDLTATRLLLVDDDGKLRDMLCTILKRGGFLVSCAGNVNDALRLIGSQDFDVLISDLHMPHDGHGLTVVSAMRHANPEALTIIFSAFPEMERAAAAILAQTDEIFVKPAAIGSLVELIRGRLKAGAGKVRDVDSVATILESETEATIQDWLVRVDRDPKIFGVELDDSDVVPICRSSSATWCFAFGIRWRWAAMLSDRQPPRNTDCCGESRDIRRP